MIYDFKASGNYFKLDFDIQLEKDQQVYCFIGENGVGKTKLLQTLAGFSLYKHSMFDYYQTREDGKFRQFKLNEELFSQIKQLKVNISDKIYFNDGYTEYDYAPRPTLLAIDDIDNRSMYFGNRQTIDKPIIFISAKNRGYISGLNDSRTFRLDGSSTERFIRSFLHTYNSIYDRDIATDSVTNWLLQRLVMANSAISGTEGLRKEATFFIECLNKFAPELNLLHYATDGKPVINCSYINGDFYIADVSIQNLSTGYASILRIIQEIIGGLSDWDNNIDLHNADGIVFIDEIDLHLHPKWQFKIIDLLKEFFPKVTFYITTHSPLVLFNLKNGEGYKLNKDEKNLVTTQKIEQNNMQFIGDIIKQFFDVDGVSIRKADEDKMKQARKNLLDFIKENQDEQ
ncbi:MAG: AAA family ATPase [Burkholderiales bacterium]|nr:AAA family ATPase [Burkholderiales bacterium]